MTPEQARFLLETQLPGIEQEWETTKKVLLAIPDKNQDYRPDPKSKTALELAWHIVSTEVWFLDGLIKGEFAMEETARPENTETVAGMIAFYENTVPALVEKLKAVPDGKLAEDVNFFGLLSQPAVTYLMFLIVHSVHHRGQLSAYLRAMGGKVPSIYGGSADEPFEMPS